jgi:YXWGXW repeat-containing protein
MSKFNTRLKITALGAVALLSACVVQQPVYRPPPPPPPQPYYPPPAPAAQPAPAAGVEVQASEAPPPLPDYEQPPCPQEGYMWTPGYWNYAPGGYFWVPGTWVSPPQVGVLWTPGYWGFVGGVYLFNAGYWGPHIGFYGGVNYGFGYGGVGYAGGRWNGNQFAYNASVNNVNTTIVHNTYNETVVNNTTVNHTSFNGGPAGTRAVATPQEQQAMSEHHIPATPMQAQHVQEARANPQLAARANGGKPPIAATPRPGAFNAPGVVGAHGATTQARPFTPPAAAPQPAQRPNTPGATPRPQGQPAQGQPGRGQPQQAQPRGQVQPQPAAKPAAKPAPKPKQPQEEKRREPEGSR